MMFQLLNLPTELILNVLLCLPSSSIITCRLVNKHLNTLIRNSIVIQYALALDAARAEDNPCSTLSKASKLQALQSSEKAWSNLQASFNMPVAVECHQSGVYDLSSGFLFLSDASRTLLYSMKLPTKKGEQVKWNEIRSTKTIVDIGLCVYEHDLIAFVTSCPRPETPGTPDSFDIEVELREISTDSPHPLAEKSTLYVMNSTRNKPAVAIEIVGKHLVLVLSFEQQSEHDHIFVFEWQKNIVKASFEADHGTYVSLLFLGEDTILLPNMKACVLDIFRIPIASTLEPLMPILRLALPTFRRGHSFVHISCRAEPNPISPSSLPEIKRRTLARAAVSGGDGSVGSEPQRAWLAKPDDALCLFDLEIESINYQMEAPLELVVHRSAIVAVVEDFESKANANVGHAASTGWENKIFTTSDSVLPSNEIAIPVASNSIPASQIPHPEPSVVPWKSWGPDITCWASANDFATRWITTSAGQRIVRMRDLYWDLDNGEEPEDDPYIVLDYNQARVEKTRKWLEAQPGHVNVRVGASGQSIGIGLMYDPHDELHEVGEGRVDIEDVLRGSTSTSSAVHTDFDNAEWESISDRSSILDEGWEYTDEIEIASLVARRRPGLELDWYNPPLGSIYWTPAGERLVPRSIFVEPLVSGLPYVARVSHKSYRYHGMMLDEERVIGTYLRNYSGPIEKIDIYHFG